MLALTFSKSAVRYIAPSIFVFERHGLSHLKKFQPKIVKKNNTKTSNKQTTQNQKPTALSTLSP